MKIVYEPGEIERIEECHAELKNKISIFNGGPDKVYGLTFKVTNPALAEYLLISLLNNRMEDFEMGIDVKSIEFDVMPRASDVKARLYQAIDSIL